MLFGAWEMLLVAVVALVVLGPDKLPEAMRRLARGLQTARRMTDDIRQNIEEAIEERPRTPRRPAQPPSSADPAPPPPQQASTPGEATPAPGSENGDHD